MAWDTDLTPISNAPISNAQVKGLRNRLLLLYVLLVATSLGIFSVATYHVVARDRNQQLDTHLQKLADSGVSALGIIDHEYHELLNREDCLGYSVLPPTSTSPLDILAQLMSRYKIDTTLHVNDPLHLGRQGVEWYDKERQLMVRVGDLFPKAPLASFVPEGGLAMQQDDLRSLTVAVCDRTPSGKQCMGYVRATTSTTVLETELYHLRWGLGFGAIAVTGLATLGGIWFTRESLKPTIASLSQLRQFTSDASHELRNPLTAIRASVAVMRTHPERIHAADVEKLAAIASASEQMSQLVDNLLLLARMDRQLPDRRVWRTIALEEMLEDAIELYSGVAEQAGITVKSRLASDLWVHGDPTRLPQLFTNLLTNALNYTPSGGTITVEAGRSDDAITVAVTDTGIGIAPEHLPRIFDRFWRADRSRHQHQGGSGLGLSIVQAIAQQHGGDVAVQSTLGVGSCFQVWLPKA